MTNIYYYDFPIGRLGIAENNSAITDIFFAHEEGDSPAKKKETDLIWLASQQLGEYFLGKRKKFDLPLAPHGTDFQKNVWQALLSIPYGETRSYKQVATLIGNDKASRAVGYANNRNPIVIVIPCHRVIGADGNLVGFGGGLDIKEKLLLQEKRIIL